MPAIQMTIEVPEYTDEELRAAVLAACVERVLGVYDDVEYEQGSFSIDPTESTITRVKRDGKFITDLRLVSLATAVWYENPDCKPIVYRQANGRIHRPGQTLPVRSVFPLYEHPLMEHGHRLLSHKVGVSLAVDGLDPDAVLEAAGVASEFSAGLNVGHQLYRMLVDSQTRNGPGEP